MKQKGPDQQRGARQQSGARQQQRGGAQRGGRDVSRDVMRPGADRSLVGRSYETGQALRSTGQSNDRAGAAQHGSDLERAADSLHQEHGERLAAGCNKAGVPVEAAAAVVLTETSQLRGLRDDKVAVRFEPYEFFRRTGRWLVATHRDQAAEQSVLAEARAIDPDAALESLRMGVAQLSGQEAESAGYDSAASMYTAMQSGQQAQIDGLVSVIQSSEALQDAMSTENWRGIAELRAGPGYGALGYDDALAAYADAYRRATVAHGGDDDGDDDKPKRKPKRTKSTSSTKPR